MSNIHDLEYPHFIGPPKDIDLEVLELVELTDVEYYEYLLECSRKGNLIADINLLGDNYYA